MCINMFSDNDIVRPEVNYVICDTISDALKHHERFNLLTRNLTKTAHCCLTLYKKLYESLTMKYPIY